MRDWATWLVIGVVLATGCTAGSDDAATDRSEPTLPLAEPLTADPTRSTGPARDLAPSQLTGETVPPPDTPPPCAIDDLTFWTAQVDVLESTATSVVRVRNVGDAWCEADIAGSPLIDPAIEPDVWLDPGGWADLVVTGESGCGDPVAVTEVRLDVNGTAVRVPVSVVASCGAPLTAFFPNDPADRPCDPADLDVVTVDASVLVRNASFEPCVLGELLSVDGGASVEPAPVARSEPAVTDLAGGDVVAFPYRVEGEAACQPDPTAVLTFDHAVAIRVGVPCGAVHELGPGRPYFGRRDGPLDALATEPLDLDDALASLDPFGAVER